MRNRLVEAARRGRRGRRVWFSALAALCLPALSWAAPTANNQTVIIGPGVEKFVTLSYGGSPTNFTIVSLPLHGTLQSYDSRYSTTAYPQYYYYKAGASYEGSDAFTWQCNDASGISGVATCSVTITSVPIVNNQTATVVTAGEVGIYLSYTDPMGGGRTYTIVSPPAHGTLQTYLQKYGYDYPGYFFYDATPGYTGTDVFTWRMNNGYHDSAVATVTIAVTPNTPPVANSSSCTVNSGVPTYVYPSVTDPDAGQQTMTYTVVGAPSHGVAVGGIGYCQYTSFGTFAGQDSFTWRVNDGLADSGVASETITVAAVIPVLQNQTACVAENTATTIHPAFTGGGGYTCNVVKVSGPSHGTLTPSGNWFVYTPVNNYVGGDSFTWRIDYSNATTPLTSTGASNCAITVVNAGPNADWTQWRFNECRSSQSPMILSDQLVLQWRRDLPVCAGSFGSGSDVDNCRPVQLGKQIFVSLQANDSVTAYDTETGNRNWRYYANGALRRPPVAMALTNGTNVVIFGCDDGQVYCLNAVDGSELWKFRGAPNLRQVMGFGRLGSEWPVWASPVAYNGRIYFVSGFMPSFGLYTYCLDAASGAMVWCNDGRLVEKGNNSTMGPLAFSTDHTKIYGTVEGKNMAWVLSAATGELTGHTGLSQPCGYQTQNWFIDGTGVNGTSEPQALTAGGQSFTPTSVAALGVAGTVGSMLAGDGKLFVWTTQGSLYCFGGASVTPNIYLNTVTPLPVVSDGWTVLVSNMLSRADLKQGLAHVWGVGSGRLVEELAKQAPGLSIVAVDTDTNKLRNLRLEMDAAGWSGARVATLQGNPMDFGFAPYQAALIASEDIAAAGFANGADMVRKLYTATRPFGGEIWLPATSAQYTSLAGWVAAAATNMPLCDIADRTGFSGIGVDGYAQIRRLGLPDAALVMKPPFGVIAFGSTTYGSALVSHNGDGAPQRGVKNGYDIYSWLPESAAQTGYEPAAPSRNNVTTNYAYFPVPPLRNPLYAFMDTPPSSAPYVYSSCSSQSGYGNLVLNPGKVPSLYEASTQYWGTVQFPDGSGCGAAVCEGNGIAVFKTSAGCKCNLGFMYTQFGLVPMANEENNAHFQEVRSTHLVEETPVRNIGINFGAVGDRYVPDKQTLWTHHPAVLHVGDALPLLGVTYRGGVTNDYHHSAQLLATSDRMSAACVRGMDGLTIPLVPAAVALPTATPPTMDGTLADACWDGRNRLTIAVDDTVMDYNKNFVAQKADATCYAMLRYDATNLYVGAGAHATYNAYSSPKRLSIALTSRERTAGVVILSCGVPGKTSTGIPIDAWTAAYSTGGADPFTAEVAVPWSALQAAGLWKEQLIVNIEVSGNQIGGVNNSTAFYLATQFTPIYLDAARGFAAATNAHTVRLYFAEMDGLTNGQRVFDVKLQGQTVLTNFDVAVAAGGPKREVMREFTGIGIADHLDIDFTRHAGEPILGGAQILSAYTDPANVLPVAQISASALTGPAPLDVTFSAQSSYDPDGQIQECAWETGDGHLARGSQMEHVFAEPGTYKVNLLVLDNRGGTGTTNVTVTVTAGAPAAFVCKIRSAGNGGDYTTLSSWQTAIKSDLTSPNSLLFTVSDRGNYAASDDGAAVTFTGGGSGTLKHINSGNIAYIAGCSGTIQTGTVTCASGHTLSVTDTGNQIYTAVAEGYNDWNAGLVDSLTTAGWVTTNNHCVTIRAAFGQGHNGIFKDSLGHYTGFAIGGNVNVSASAYTRIAGVIVNLPSNWLELGLCTSVDRVLVGGTVFTPGGGGSGGTGSIVANSVGGLFIVQNANCSFYNCTGKGFTSGNLDKVRFVNCLAAVPGATGFSGGSTLMAYTSHCISTNASATVWDVWGDGREKNLANRAVNFVNPTIGDYHLADGDLGARGRGVPGLGADVSGTARVGLSAFDVGAAQNLSAFTNLATITASVGSAGGGTISPSGPVSVALGADQSFTIAPSNGYIVASLVVDGTTLPGATSYTFPAVDNDHSIVANFVAIYTIAASAGAGGSISPSGSVQLFSGSNQTFTIAAAGGYQISDVQVDGSSVGLVASYPFINVTNNHTIAASFTMVTIPPVITSSLSATGSVNVPFNYTIGTTNSPVGYVSGGLPSGLTFDATNGIISGTPTLAGFYPVSLTVSNYVGADTETLNLTILPPPIFSLNVNMSGNGSGAVGLSPTGGSYTAGTVVTLTATPDASSLFAGWSGNLSGSANPTTILMDGPKSVTAAFPLKTFTVFAPQPAANGSIAPYGIITVNYGDSQAFTIAPAAWYAIADVLADGVSVGTPASYNFANITANHTLSASFAALLAPKGTPLWWLAQYGYTNNFAAAELADSDGDGVPNWLEYLDGTDPTDPLSRVPWNTLPYAESFENLAGWGGQYGSVLGHMGWSSSAPRDDHSRITNLVYTFSATNYPLPGATHTNVLQLGNLSAVLSNSFGAGFDMSAAVTYFDTMVQFGLSSGQPAICTPVDTGTKGGAFANPSNYLAIYHGVAAVDGMLLSNQVDVTSVYLIPTNWYRLTMIADATATNPANALAMFQVKLNGVAVTSAAAYDNTWKALFNTTGQLPAPGAGGTWFRMATTNSATKRLTALAFTGTGYIDDLVVNTIDPFAPPAPVSFTLILVQAGNGSSSLGGASPFTAVPIAANATTQIVYTAADWYRINALASNGAPVTAASGVQAFTQTLANIIADISNNVAFALATPEQTGFTNVPTAWLTNWPQNAVYAGGGDGFSVSAKYLLGLDPTASNSYALAVDSLHVTSNNVVVTLKRTVSGALSPDGMHGYLTLQATPKLGVAFTDLVGAAVTGATVFDGTGHKAYTNAVDASNRFFKAVVK